MTDKPDYWHFENKSKTADDNVFFPREVEPDLQLLVPPIRPNMAEGRILFPDPFSGSSKEDAAEFWRRLETSMEYKHSDDGDKLRLATAMFVITARDWFESLPEGRKDTFAHLKAAFDEKFIQPAANAVGNGRRLCEQN